MTTQPQIITHTHMIICCSFTLESQCCHAHRAGWCCEK